MRTELNNTQNKGPVGFMQNSDRLHDLKSSGRKSNDGGHDGNQTSVSFMFDIM